MKSTFLKFTLSVLFGLLLSFSVQANKEVDSLRTLLSEATADTSRFDLMNAIAWHYFEFNLDSALQYAQQEQALVQQLDDQHRTSVAFVTLGIIYEMRGEYELALKHQQDALDIRLQLGNKEHIASSYNSVGIVLDYMGKDDEALINYKKSLDIRLEIKDYEGIEGSYSNIGLLLYEKGSYKEALDYFFKALDVAEEHEMITATGVINNHLGMVFKVQGDQEKSLQYYMKAVEIQESINDVYDLSFTYNNIGGLLNEMARSKEALDYLRKALETKLQVGEHWGTAAVYQNLGNAFENLALEDSALLYYDKSFELRKQIGDITGQIGVLNSLSSFYEAQDQYRTSLQYLQWALDLNKEESGTFEDMKEIYFTLAKCYSGLGQYERAYYYQSIHITYKDSALNEENLKKMAQLELSYQFAKQQKLDSLDRVEEERKQAFIRKEEKIKQEEDLKRQQLYTWGGIGLALLALGFAFILFRANNQKKRDNEIISTQKELVEEKNKEIVDSITYAKRLQEAILPSFEEVGKHLPNNFVLFKPKDVVSGDFYWFERVHNRAYLAAADCTGHGVPGAMVSVVCSNALNRSVNEFGISEPNDVLNKTRDLVIETFAKSGEEVKDGMDIALCAFVPGKVIFSGANNPLWIVRKTDLLTNEQRQARSTVITQEIALIEIKPNKQPIGLYEGMTAFTQQEIDLMDGDTLYCFTDGFADQFGGEAGKKLKYKPFKKLLLSLYNEPMEKQKAQLDAFFESWKGQLEQVDDVCVIGVKP